MYNKQCKANDRIRNITCGRLVSKLPSIYFSNGGDLGIFSVRSFIKKFVISPNLVNAWLAVVNCDFVARDGLSSGLTYSTVK